jgi:excisionase family DNA binding protein
MNYLQERWLTVEEICKYLDATNETINKWIDSRGMPRHKDGRRRMYKIDEVDVWVRSGGAADKASESPHDGRK